MDIVLEVESRNVQKLKDLIGKDDLASRASMTFRDGSVIGKEGQLCLFSGTDEQCGRLLEISKEIAKRAGEKDSADFIVKVREEESKSSEGLGFILG